MTTPYSERLARSTPRCQVGRRPRPRCPRTSARAPLPRGVCDTHTRPERAQAPPARWARSSALAVGRRIPPRRRRRPLAVSQEGSYGGGESSLVRLRSGAPVRAVRARGPRQARLQGMQGPARTARLRSWAAQGIGRAPDRTRGWPRRELVERLPPRRGERQAPLGILVGPGSGLGVGALGPSSLTFGPLTSARAWRQNAPSPPRTRTRRPAGLSPRPSRAVHPLRCLPA